MVELRDPSLDYFVEFFDPPEVICDVPVAHSVHDDRYLEAAAAAEVRFVTPDEAAVLAAGGTDVTDEFLGLQTYHGLDRINGGTTDAKLRERHRYMKTFYASIVPRQALRVAIERFHRDELLSAFAVGVNIRTGNGGAAFTRGGTFAGRFDGAALASPSFLKKVSQACRERIAGMPRFLRGEDPQIFVVTDSDPMRALLMQLPGATTRRTTFPPYGSDHQFSNWDADGSYTDRDSVTDTIVDMFLLSRVNALVYNDTNFNRLALTVTDYFSGNHANIERYFVRGRVRRGVGRVRRAVGARSH